MAIYREIDIYRIDKSSPYYRDPYVDKKKIKKLAKSILKNGLVNPIIVKKIVGMDRFLLITGRKRLLAYEKLSSRFDFKYRKIPCLVEEIKDINILKIQIIESLFYSKYSVLDSAKLVEEVLKVNNYDTIKTAQELGKSLSFLKSIVLYIEAIDRVIKNIDKKLIPKLAVLSKKIVTAINKIEDEQLIEPMLKDVINNHIPLKIIKMLIKVINSGDIPQTITINLKSLYQSSNNVKPKVKKPSKSKVKRSNINFTHIQQIKNYVNELKDCFENPRETYQVSFLFSEIDNLLDEVKGYDISKEI